MMQLPYLATIMNRQHASHCVIMQTNSGNSFGAGTDLWSPLCRPDVYSCLLRHGRLADAGNVHVLQGEEQNESR